MTAEPSLPRSATLVAALVLLGVHAVLLVGGTAASGLSLATFVVTHPGWGWTPSVLVPSASSAVLTVVLAAGDVVLGLRLFNAARRARPLLTGWLGLSGLITLTGMLTSLTRVATPNIPFVTLWVLELVVCVATVVLLWLRPTSTWLRGASVRSVRPTGPGPERRAP